MIRLHLLPPHARSVPADPKIVVMRAGSANQETEKAGTKVRAEAGVDGPVGRNPMDPLLMRLVHDYVDDRDLTDRLAKLFLVGYADRKTPVCV